MKNINRNAKVMFVLASLLVVFPLVKAERFKGDPIRKTNAPTQKAATCLPATSSSELNINNVRAYIETSGSMWFKEIARYVVPKSGQASSMFAAALWIGGMDITGQLKLAAIRFRQQGDDFWPGPLNLKTADIDQAVCSYYDKHFIMHKKTALDHKNKYADPDYQMPTSIREWPAHPFNYTGDNTGPSYYLAPFYDADGDGVYTPERGDYPYYDFDNELCPWTDENRARAAKGELPQTFESKNGISTGGIMADQVLKGDQTLWWVFNDKGAAHTETKGSPIGLEIRGQAFAFATNDELNNMTFYSYEIINRSSYELTETYFSQWVDPDLGYAKDDYIGCDVQRGLGYCYNGYNVDGTGLVTHYGENPPAVGVDFFQGPYLDPDGYDNPSFSGDGIFGPSMFGSCEIVTAHDNLRQFTWDKTGEGDYTTDYILVKAEAINGVNFGDGIVDNERFGMRRFVYHSNIAQSDPTSDPSKAWEYYNMLRGIWKDNTKMRYGGNGHKTTGPECDFMFPGDTDPCNWGTGGVVPNVANWTDKELNTPEDRRFMQSAGPFTLKKGAINYITVGIPWARATGSPWASVELLKIVDDKCQNLFESCFKVIEGPDAPDLVFKEMDNRLICFITNTQGSNNYTNTPEDYMELDYSIPSFRIKQTVTTSTDTLSIIVCDTIYPDPNDSSIVNYTNCRDTFIHITTAETFNDTVFYDRYYRFEGYQIYQLANATVTADQINDITKAVLVYQCDIKNDVSQIINYEYNATVSTEVPVEKVNGINEGIQHSFILTRDQFNSGAPLVNYKKYYYLAIAYAYNNFAEYSTNADNPEGLFGQKVPYLAGNKNIKVYTAIPHKNVMEENGTQVQASYGMQPPITQFEGQGNGGNILMYKQKTIDEILLNGKADSLMFEANHGPITVKVVDPLKVKGYDYILRFYNPDNDSIVKDSTRWMLIYTNEENVVDTIFSETAISQNNEQLLLDLGLSINIVNQKFTLLDKDFLAETEANYWLLSTVDFLSSSITFKDSTRRWLSGVPDVDELSPLNWIRSGKTKDQDYFMRNADGYSWDHSNARKEDYYEPILASDTFRLKKGIQVSNGVYCWFDGEENFEKFINRTWAPYPMASRYDEGPQFGYEKIEDLAYVNKEDVERIGESQHIVTMTQLYSVDVVLTPDKSKWTRCPVVEICGDNVLTIGNAMRHNLRKSPSIDKNGIPTGAPGCNESEATLVSDTGMGWFPGYAICIETGERLNMMYGENSWLSKENGTDMIFNPTRNMYNSGYVFGGQHYIYVFGHQDLYTPNASNPKLTQLTSETFISPAYDQGKWAHDLLLQSEKRTSPTLRIRDKAMVYKNIMWTSIPIYNDAFDWLENEVTIRLRVSRPYQRWSSSLGTGVENPVNKNMPWYKFSTKSMETMRDVVDSVKSAMDMINVVPNPYFARSAYEADQLDTRIKFINLPKACTIRIYTLNGVLVRTLKKDNVETYVEWDLKNEADIPVAGGVYLIHITDTKTKQTKTLKWFGIQRPTDVNAF